MRIEKIDPLSHNRLAVALGHEVGHLLLLRSIHTLTAAISHTVLPHVVAVRVVAAVAVVTSLIVVAVGSRLVEPTAVLSRGLGEPLIVVSVTRSGRHGIVGCAIARVGGGERSAPWVLIPANLAWAVGMGLLLLSFDRLVVFVLGDLLPEVARVGRCAVLTAVSRQLGVDGGDERSKSVAAGLSSLLLLHGSPVAPVVKPGLVILAHVKVDVETPAHGLEPLALEGVELRDGNATNFGPGAVLERVVVKELAAQEERNGQISPNLSFGGLVGNLALTLQSVDSLGKVVHAQKNGGTRKSRRSEDLSHKLAKGGGDRSIGSDNSRRHLSNVLGHHVDLIIEDGTHATGHFGGIKGGDRRRSGSDLCRRRSAEHKNEP